MTNLFKSIYISVYVTVLAIVSSHAIYGLVQQGLGSFWVGIAIGVIPSLLFFVRLFLSPVARTSSNLNGLVTFSLVGAALAFSLSSGPADQSYVYLYGLAVGVGGLILYIYWYSNLGRSPSEQLEVGKALPLFELRTSDGNTWSSTKADQHPALFLFFRGNWCPLCMAQIKEVAAHYQQLDAMGVKVFLVSPQPEKNTQSLAKKFEVNYHFMIDEGNQAANKLGIAAQQGTPKGMEILGYDSDTVLPTAILTDQSGHIIFTDQTDNYRVRPEPETFLRVFQEHGLNPQA